MQNAFMMINAIYKSDSPNPFNLCRQELINKFLINDEFIIQYNLYRIIEETSYRNYVVISFFGSLIEKNSIK